MLTIATEVWIATARLHRRYPDRADFTISDIADEARRLMLAGSIRAGLLPHLYLHCVANRPPNPARLRMLFATGKHTRRLYRPGDSFDRDRAGGATAPDRAGLPEHYQDLWDWYAQEYAKQQGGETAGAESDPILRLRGLGKSLWAGENPDRYVERLRQGWQ